MLYGVYSDWNTTWTWYSIEKDLVTSRWLFFVQHCEMGLQCAIHIYCLRMCVCVFLSFGASPALTAGPTALIFCMSNYLMVDCFDWQLTHSCNSKHTLVAVSEYVIRSKRSQLKFAIFKLAFWAWFIWPTYNDLSRSNFFPLGMLPKDPHTQKNFLLPIWKWQI